MIKNIIIAALSMMSIVGSPVLADEAISPKIAIVLAQPISFKDVQTDPPSIVDGTFRYRYKIIKTYHGHTSRRYFSIIEFGALKILGKYNYYALLDESKFDPSKPDESDMVITIAVPEYGFCLDGDAALYAKIPEVKKFQMSYPCR